MKKLAITLIIICAVAGAKAQQIPLFPKQQPLQKFRVPVDSLTRNNFTYKMMDSLGKIKSMPSEQRIIANSTVDNMPIVRHQGYHNMPIVKTDPTAYNMPTARVGASDNFEVIEKKKWQPGNTTTK